MYVHYMHCMYIHVYVLRYRVRIDMKSAGSPSPSSASGSTVRHDMSKAHVRVPVNLLQGQRTL